MPHDLRPGRRAARHAVPRFTEVRKKAMFDPKSLLDQFLGAGGSTAQSAARPPVPTPGGGAPAAPGGVDGLLEQGQSFLQGTGGGLAGGALAGGAVSLLLGSKKARKVGGKALTYGGLALVGALAYGAWRNYQTRRQVEGTAPAAASGAVPSAGAARAPAELLPPPDDTPFSPANAPGGEANLARVILRAMIAAAKADGHVDADEQRRIFDRLDEMGIGAEERAFVFEELGRPLDVEGLVAEATTPELAAEIYAASLLAIEPDQPAEKAYLDLLATRLALPPELVEELHAAVAAAEER